MKTLKEYILEAEDLLGLGDSKDSGKDSKDSKDSGGDDLLGLDDTDTKDDEKSDDKKDDKSDDQKQEDPKDDKGSKPQIDPKLKERAEIKFKIWKDGGERADWIKDNDGYQKIEYVYKDRKKGIVIDFLLGRKDGEWSLWAGKNGGVSYDDEPMYDLDAKTFQSALMNSLDKIQDLIADVKANPANWPQYYINK